MESFLINYYSIYLWKLVSSSGYIACELKLQLPYYSYTIKAVYTEFNVMYV